MTKNTDEKHPDYSFQKNMVSTCLSNLYKRKKTVLAASCGAGKTIMSINIIENYLSKYKNARILILTHGQSVLRTQYFNVIKDYFNKNEIFILDSNNDEIILNKKIIITLPHTIFKLNELNLGYFDLIVIDEAHNFYLVGDGMVQNILNRAKHKCELLLTGSPSKFISINKNKKSNEYEIISMSSSELLQKNIISDVKIMLLQSDDYKFNIYDYHSKNEVRKRKIDVNLTKNVLLEVAQEIYALEKKNLNNFSFLSAFKLIKKMMIVAIDEHHAFQISKILNEIGLKNIISTYSFDLKSEEIENFKNNPEIKTLIVVQRGILGFNFPELQCIIDISLSLNPDKIFQTINRVVRRFENKPKLFIKVMPKDVIELAQVALSCASALSVKKVYESYAGEYNNLLVPVINKKEDDISTFKHEKKKNGKKEEIGKKVEKKTPLIDIFSFDVMQKIYEEKNVAISKYAWTTFYRTRKKLLQNKSWTFEECLKEALKYKTPTEWSNNGRSGYRAAHQYGWFKACSAHMIIGTKRWTPELCLQEAKKYKIVSQWTKNSLGSYQAALRFGILDKCKEHMKNLRNSWTPEFCLQEAKKYNTVSEWRGKSYSSYQYALRHGDLYEECKTHMKKLTHNWNPASCLLEGRKYSSVKEWKQNSPTSYQMASNFRILPECTKHMVSNRKRWTPEECISEARKYKTIKDWRLNNKSSYAAAIKFKILMQCKLHMGNYDSKIKKWPPEICIKESQRYTTRGEWQKYSKGSYTAAKTLGIFDKCIQHMNAGNKKWTEELCLAEAKKYSKKSAWMKCSSGSYSAARRLGIVSKCIQHIEENRISGKYKSSISINTNKLQQRFNKWTEESCLKEAKKYTNVRQWQKSGKGSYSAARRLGIFDRCTTHMTDKNIRWTHELCIKEAKKYKSITKWREGCDASFKAASRLGILNECTKHMKKYKSVA